MRLGILGGTFDPIHEGHLAMARAALDALGLARVLLVPCARPPHKERPDLTGGHLRFAMAALAADGDERLVASPIELERGGVSYTVETLRDLASAHPGHDPVLIVGADSFAEMTTWRQWDEILARAPIAVVPRPGSEDAVLPERLAPPLAAAIRAAGPEPPLAAPAAIILSSRPVGVSSTEIRRRVREGVPISGLVPAPVERFIRRQELYVT